MLSALGTYDCSKAGLKGTGAKGAATLVRLSMTESSLQFQKASLREGPLNLLSCIEPGLGVDGVQDDRRESVEPEWVG